MNTLCLLANIEVDETEDRIITGPDGSPAGSRTYWNFSMWVALCLLCSGVLSCTDTVDPLTDDTLLNPFYIYGYLDTGSDTQFVRVQLVRRTPEPGNPNTRDLIVRSRNADIEQTVTWRDSLVMLENGNAAHLFYALFSPLPGDTYFIEAIKSDGSITSARTTVPEEPEVVVEPAFEESGVLMQNVVWRGIRTVPEETEVVYQIVTGTSRSEAVAIKYHQAGSTLGEDWVIPVILRRDLSLVRARLGISSSDSTLFLCGVQMEMVQLSQEWRQPQNSTIQNGYGFFGSTGQFVASWKLDPAVIKELGFQDCDLLSEKDDS